MIEKDHGFAIAQTVARSLIVYQRRAGGQRQHSPVLDLRRFGPVIEWARLHLGEPLDVARLADRCGLSPRQFTRAFTAATGVPPARAIEALRVDRAQADIALKQDSLEVLARRYGFGSSARMRRSFIRCMGSAPRSLQSGSDSPLS